MNPLTAEQVAERQDRAMSCYPLAEFLAKRATRNLPALREDVRGRAMLALAEAAAEYNPGAHGGAKFITFAHMVVRQGVSNEIDRTFLPSRDRRRERLTAAPPERPDPPDPGEDGFGTLLGLVPPRTAAVMRLYYADGFKMPEIGRRYGLSRQRVQQVIRAGLAAIRNHPAARAYAPDGSPVRVRRPQPRPGRPCRTLTAFGETKNLRQWVADPRCGVAYATLWGRLCLGMQPEDAISCPARRRGRKASA